MHNEVVKALKDGKRTLDKIKETFIISEGLELELKQL